MFPCCDVTSNGPHRLIQDGGASLPGTQLGKTATGAGYFMETGLPFRAMNVLELDIGDRHKAVGT